MTDNNKDQGWPFPEKSSIVIILVLVEIAVLWRGRISEYYDKRYLHQLQSSITSQKQTAASLHQEMLSKMSQVWILKEKLIELSLLRWSGFGL